VHVLIAEMHHKGIGPLRDLTRLCAAEVRQADASAGAVDQVLKKYTKYAPPAPLKWIPMLDSLAEDTERATLVLRWMEANGAAPNAMHYQKVVQACEKDSNWDQVHVLIAEMHHKGIGPLRDLTRLCAAEVRQADASAGAVDQVLKKYTKYVLHNPEQWAAMLTGLVHESRVLARGTMQVGDTERVTLMLRWMEANGAAPNAIMHYERALQVCEKEKGSNNWDQVHVLIAEMHHKGIGPLRDLTRLCAAEVRPGAEKIHEICATSAAPMGGAASGLDAGEGNGAHGTDAAMETNSIPPQPLRDAALSGRE
jgi:predicted Zn-dependent protease with MMP-like domain